MARSARTVVVMAMGGERDTSKNRRLAEFDQQQDNTTLCGECGIDYDAGRHGYGDGKCPDCRE